MSWNGKIGALGVLTIDRVTLRIQAFPSGWFKVCTLQGLKKKKLCRVCDWSFLADSLSVKVAVTASV